LVAEYEMKYSTDIWHDKKRLNFKNQINQKIQLSIIKLYSPPTGIYENSYFFNLNFQHFITHKYFYVDNIYHRISIYNITIYSIAKLCLKGLKIEFCRKFNFLFD
jgi:hypothetical protein